MASIENKGTALFTGASLGIGAVYADRLARQGYDLILVARNRDRLPELANRLTTETGRSVEIVTADLGGPADLAQVEAVLLTDASVTMLVNNAGVALPDKAEWDAFDAARHAMSGRLSSAFPAARYNAGPSQSTGA